jgi:hypothetical protein
MPKQVTTEEFIKRAKQKHGDKYDYSKTVYTNQKTKLTITCPIHGDFQQLPTNHYKYECNLCGNKKIKETETKSLEQFIEESLLLHNSKYSYENAVYTGARNHLLVTCPDHGDWSIMPTNHLKGHGCPECKYAQNHFKRSYYKNLPTILYVAEINETGLYKIGITKQTFSIRYANEPKITNSAFEISFIDGRDAWDFEKEIVRHFKELKYKGPQVLKYTKNTEILTVNPINYIKQRIVNEQRKNTLTN